MKYNVQITKACTQTVLVEADSYDQAKLKAYSGQYEEASKLEPKYYVNKNAIVNAQDQDMIAQKNDEVQKFLEEFSPKMNERNIPEVFTIKLNDFKEVKKVLKEFGLDYYVHKVAFCPEESDEDYECFEYVFWEVGTEEPTELIEAIKYSYTDDYQF
mgnify:CR=1 FL=1